MSFITKYFRSKKIKEIISWSLFDFANSSYTVIITSFLFPIFFKEVIAGNSNADLYWGLVVSISILLGGLFSPIIGAISDYSNKRRAIFITFASLGIIGTASLYFTSSNTLLIASILFISTHFCVEISTSLYDSFLNQISRKDNSGRISGFGWGLGYLGGLVALLLFKPLYAPGFAGGLESTYKLTFVFTALFFLVFSLPIFLFIKDNKTRKRKHSIFFLIKTGFANTFSTIRNIRKHKTIAWFLLGFYFMNDALVTIFSFIPIYAKTTLSMSLEEIMVAVLVVHIIGFIATVMIGPISDKYGHKRILLLTMFLWCINIFLLFIVNSKAMFYVIVVISGLIMGSSQAVARAWLSNMIPKHKRGEFFGFNGFASKISATTGPILFGAISVITGNQRIAVLALMPFFIIAFIIFYRIKKE